MTYVKETWTKDEPVTDADPYRRLLAAITLRAVKDYLAPPKRLSRVEVASAADFCRSEAWLIAWLLGCTECRIKRVLFDERNKQ